MAKNYIEVDGVKFVKESTIKKEAQKKDGLTLCMLRTYSAGVWYGYVDYDKAEYLNCEVLEAVRVWKWYGAFTLSALATDGTDKADDCRFAIEIDKIKLSRVVEFIPITEKSLKTLSKVKRG